MASAYLVMAEVDYEQSNPVRVFLSKDEAFHFQQQCTQYHETRPKSPLDMGDEPAWDAYWAANEAWKAAHPAGEEWCCDYYTLREVPLSPSVGEPSGVDAGRLLPERKTGSSDSSRQGRQEEVK